jgi:hypothetical protein
VKWFSETSHKSKTVYREVSSLKHTVQCSTNRICYTSTAQVETPSAGLLYTRINAFCLNILLEHISERQEFNAVWTYSFLINTVLSNTDILVNWLPFELEIGILRVWTQKLVTMTEIFTVCLFHLKKCYEITLHRIALIVFNFLVSLWHTHYSSEASR